MPYIFVEELPEGVDAADVVTREEHDEYVSRLNDTQERVDGLVTALEDAREEVRKAKAKYADYLLGQSDQPAKEQPKEQPVRTTLPMSAKELFAGKE